MKDYKTRITEDLRLTILRVLVGVKGAVNASSMTKAARPLGFNVNRDEVEAEMQWLRDAKLVRIEDMDGLLVATLNRRGGDVAAGRTTVAGVSSPSEIE